MSQQQTFNTGGGSGAVNSVTGTNGVTASPTTGNVTVSGVLATTTTVGVASFSATNFNVSGGGEVTLVNDGLITLNADSGSALVGNDFNVDGYMAGSSPVMKTFTSGGNFLIADQSFLSRYVVDTNTTAGEAGTYSTLAAAITQAIADGATGVGKTIYLRNCTISETITFSTNGLNINIVGTSGKSTLNSVQGGAPIFSGSFTNSSSTSTITFCDIDITGTVNNTSTGGIIINDCTASGILESSGIDGFLNLSQVYCYNPTINASHGTLSTFACNFLAGTINFSNDIIFYDSFSYFAGTITGSTSSTLFFTNSSLPLTQNSMTSGTLQLSNCVFDVFSFFANTNVTYQISNFQQGNVLNAVRTATNYAIQTDSDYYIGVTDTSSARTITVPTSNVLKNQVFIVKDESGGAATNNITLTPASGTIDGASTYVINSNYGAVEIIFDGTHWFVKNKIASSGGGFTPVNFSAKLSGNIANVTGDNTQYTILYDTVVFNNGGGTYSSSTGNYTIPATGIYQINLLHFVFGGSVAQTDFLGFLLINGSTNIRLMDANPGALGLSSASNEFIASGSYLYSATAGDTISGNVEVGNATKNVGVAGGTESCLFSIFRVA